ncbi:hypothetical protein FOHLNKBM_0160 [Methylobacterium longum]|nr:hypothetical protein FOHLNKBM_0160 [Methylobacterium longum]
MTSKPLEDAFRFHDQGNAARLALKIAFREFIASRVGFQPRQEISTIETITTLIECASGCLAKLRSREVAADVLEDVARRLRRHQRIDF